MYLGRFAVPMWKCRSFKPFLKILTLLRHCAPFVSGIRPAQSVIGSRPARRRRPDTREERCAEGADEDRAQKFSCS